MPSLKGIGQRVASVRLVPSTADNDNDNVEVGSSISSSGNAVTTEYKSYQQGDSSAAPNTPDNNNGSSSAPPPPAPRPTPGVYRPSRPYSGFSTSLCSLFQFTPLDDDISQTSTIRTDCCSMACFGILQSDRTRYLLTGKRPPTLLRRMWIHCFAPLFVFCTAGYSAVYIQDKYTNSFVVTMLVLLLVLYVGLDCLRGTVKRRQVREEMLWRMWEMDMIDQGRGEEATQMEWRIRRNDSDEHGGMGSIGIGIGSAGSGRGQGEVDLGQSRRAMNCVHRTCGCAWVDHPKSDGGGGHGEEPEPHDFCSRLWHFFANLCCGKLCRCWFQFCGVCALAQEAREVERLIPAGRRRIDYVTFEPYLKYYNPIRMLRQSRNSSLMTHYGALSELSSTLVRTLFVVIVTMLILSFIPRFGGFTRGDLVVLLATLCQAFLILWLVHWKFHKFDISLDAVIKYFACGFLLTTGLAVFFELVETIFIHVLLLLAISLSGIQSVKSNDFSSTMTSGRGFGRLGMRFLASGFRGGHGRYLQDQADDMSKTFAREYPVLTIIYLFVNAYLMAALVEELCKYFGFRMVEHPDFLTEEQLQEGTEAVGAAERRAAREEAQENKEGDDDEEDDDAGMEDDCGAYSAMPGDATDTLANAFGEAADAAVSIAAEAVGATSPRAESDLVLAPAPTRKLSERGNAITIAMVAVALGFACCENLVYIFIYNGTSLETKVAVLILRSLFPIHPLAAAIQSIGVCKHDLEKDRNFGVGRSILPAILLHGSFDFALMIAQFLVAINPDEEQFEENAEMASLIVSTVVFGVAFAYYFVQSRNQNKRLDELDKLGSAQGLVTQHAMV